MRHQHQTEIRYYVACYDDYGMNDEAFGPVTEDDALRISIETGGQVWWREERVTRPKVTR